MAAKTKDRKTLELSGDVPERSEIIFPDGSKREMRAIGELPIGAIKRLRSLQDVDDDLEGIYDALRIVIVDPSDDQIESLTVDHVQKIIGFFSQAAGVGEQTNTSKQSRRRSGSTEAGLKTG